LPKLITALNDLAEMPESNSAAKRRQQKANRAMGLGDEQGRLVRTKDPPRMSLCTVCQQSMKITKTNTELTAHATGKHNSTLEECFPGATLVAAELAAKVATGQKSSSDNPNSKSNAKVKVDLDELFSAGLEATKKKGKR